MKLTPRDAFWSDTGLEEHIQLRHGSRDAPLKDVRRFDSMDSLVYRVQIDDVLYAFRPAGPGAAQQRIAQHTYAAFLLNRALGLRTVPEATIARLHIHQKGQTHAWTGILSRWLTGKRYNTRSYQHALSRDAHPQHLAAALTFEFLVNNTDVHHGNFYLDDDGRPIIFDHSLAFGPREAPAAFFLGAAPPTTLPTTLLRVLHDLDDDAIRTLLEPHLDAPTLDMLLLSREQLLERDAERVALLEEAGQDFDQREVERLEAAALAEPESGEAFALLCQHLRNLHPDADQALELFATLNVHDRPENLHRDAASIATSHALPTPLTLQLANHAPRPSVARALAEVLAQRLLTEDSGNEALRDLITTRLQNTHDDDTIHQTLTHALIRHRVDTLSHFDDLDALLSSLHAPQDLVLWTAKRLIGLSQPARAQPLLDLIDDLDARDRIEITLIRKYAQLGDRDALYAIAYDGENAGFAEESVAEANDAIARLGR